MRGGSYSRSALPQGQVEWLQTQLNHADGRCLSCGVAGHFARDCTMMKGGHDDSSSSGSDGSPRATTRGGGSGSCFRCGRGGHWSRDCYARTHVDGRRL